MLWLIFIRGGLQGSEKQKKNWGGGGTHIVQNEITQEAFKGNHQTGSECHTEYMSE